MSVHTGTHRDEQRGQEGATAIAEKYTNLLKKEDEASKDWTDHLMRNCTSVWKLDPKIQAFEADASQRDGGTAM